MKKRWSDVLGENPHWLESKTLVELFRMAAAYAPEHRALVTDEGILTYRDLEEKSNQVALALKRAGAACGQIVAVGSGRSALSVIAFLAIWKIGCAYVFLDPDFPVNRRAGCLKECGACMEITQDFVREAFLTQPVSAVEEEGDCDRLAVIVYTSGSSGNAKGVKISQRNMLASAAHYSDLGICSEDHYACFASLMFIAAVFDLSVSLLAGATLYLVPGTIRKNVTALAQYYGDHQITVTFLPPHMAVKYIQIDEGSPLRVLLCGSEPVRNLRKRPYEIIQVYASSEACAIISWYKIEDERRNYPVGRLVSGLKGYIVDSEGHPVSYGMRGELWLSGPQMTSGYLNLPQLNEARFMDNPFEHGEPYKRVYCTGDLVSADENGVMTYCGRVDNMVKIRGFRVELAGIERRMGQFPGIKEACCVAHMDSGGTNLLFGYYLCEEPIDHEALRSFLAQYLPYYMIPIGLIRMERFPRTWSEKVDRLHFAPPPELDDHKLIERLYR